MVNGVLLVSRDFSHQSGGPVMCALFLHLSLFIYRSNTIVNTFVHRQRNVGAYVCAYVRCMFVCVILKDAAPLLVRE